MAVAARGGAKPGRTPLRSLVADERLFALERNNVCLDEATPAPLPQAWPDWAAAHIAGGDVPPARVIADPYPTLHSVAVDPLNDKAFVSDPNRHALWSYERRAASKGDEAVAPLTGIRGPATGMMFIAAVTVDPEAKEIYTVDNDIGDRMMVFPYDANGNVKPIRALSVPHQAWGLSNQPGAQGDRGERRGAAPDRRLQADRAGHDAPLRMIRGRRPGSAIRTASTSTAEQRDRRRQPRQPERPRDAAGRRAGRAARRGGARARPRRRRPLRRAVDHRLPGDATGDVAPIRKIQGARPA
jgi:hypothetical protein